KSKGNFYTYRDLVAMGHRPRAIRYLLLSAPHHKQLNFTIEGLQGAEITIDRLNDFRRRLSELVPAEGEESVPGMIAETERRFNEAMDDDLNTAGALAAVHDFVRETNSLLAQGAVGTEGKKALQAQVDRFDLVFNIFGPAETELLDAEIQSLIDERQEARRSRNFVRSDEIRDLLTARGIILEDTRDGVRWRRK
ncbi:MAG: cysteine--tRNA ligase, partial [Acidobacteria bacterium]|nr:cysteine--tRNA ligase [Acidobacteriota bacterium]